MKILITGGAGFIGSHLAEKLLEQNNEVFIIDNLSTGSLDNIKHLMENPRFHVTIETIQNEVVMDRLMSICDQVYHLAAAVGVELIVKNPVEVIETNINGTGMVLKLANRYMRRVLITSTSEIYGKNEKVPFSEEDDRILGPTTKSRWCYSTSKAIDEYLALAYYKEKNVETVVVRLFNTVGPRQTGQYGMVMPRLIEQAIKNMDITVYGDGSQIRCFTYVDDSVNALVGIMNSSKATGQIFNIGNDDPITILELANKIKSAAGSSSKIVVIPYDTAYEKGFEDMQIRIPDISKIKEYIGFEPNMRIDSIIESVVSSMKKELGL